MSEGFEYGDDTVCTCSCAAQQPIASPFESSTRTSIIIYLRGEVEASNNHQATTKPNSKLRSRTQVIIHARVGLDARQPAVPRAEVKGRPATCHRARARGPRACPFIPRIITKLNSSDIDSVTVVRN